MNGSMETMLRVALVGAGATVVMDVWLMVLKRLGVPTLNFAFIGRWIGHGLGFRWARDGIAKAPPVRGELLLGWLGHYATGVLFALLLVGFCGPVWLQTPSVAPALAVGVFTVLIPLLVMQPALGAGVASSRTPRPLRNVLKSVANHAVFGLGLYVAALVVARLA